MIIVKHIDDSLYFPISKQPESATGLTLEMYSELSLTTLTFSDLSGEVNDDYIIIDLSEYADQIPNGEYNATLYDCDYEKVSLTLVRLDLEEGGEYDDPEYIIYEDEMDGYITTQNQDEAYEQGYTDGVESGYTSGYTTGYQSGFTDGYESGFTDGVDSVPLVATGFTSNGTFSATTGGFNVVTVNVPTGITPSGQIEIFENGIYDVTEKASANVQIPVEDYYQSGYTSGYTVGYQSGFTVGYESGFTDGKIVGYESGYTAGYQSGVTDGVESGYTSGYTTGYQSGYTNGYDSGFTDGFSSGYTSGETDGFQSGYSSGYTDGVDSVPLNSTGFTENGIFRPSEGGWNEVEVNVPTGITPTGQIAISGNGTYDVTQYASANVNIPLSTTGITSNGTYTKESGGWNEVTVNVPSVTTQTMTQAQYDALTIKDPMIIYLING